MIFIIFCLLLINNKKKIIKKLFSVSIVNMTYDIINYIYFLDYFYICKTNNNVIR